MGGGLYTYTRPAGVATAGVSASSTRPDRRHTMVLKERVAGGICVTENVFIQILAAATA
jgi:hypothetical protein